MLVPRLPVLSALLVLLLAAGRCTAAALLRGSGGRDALQPLGRWQRAALGVHHGPEGHSRDPRHKEKFIIHLTGPLSFDPKCRKQFHRLYYNTRDCTVPAYYKRCARLLTQLAKSPRCTER